MRTKDEAEGEMRPKASRGPRRDEGEDEGPASFIHKAVPASFIGNIDTHISFNSFAITNPDVLKPGMR